MISQLFILSERGDTIITRDFRGDLNKSTHDIFFHQAKTFKGDVPPVLNLEGLNFLHLRKKGLYILVTTQFNISPSFAFEMLQRLAVVIKDLCGVLSEEAIRKNFVYVYEIIDEMFDCGYPQSVQTEQIRPYLVNDPILVAPAASSSKIIPSKSLPSTAVQRSVASKKQKNEIFVDVYERLSVLFNQNGYIIHSSIDGCIQMKSFLQDNPQLRLALNENIVVGRSAGSGALVLDDANFHECVGTSEFDEFKILSITPPDGEFIVMNYRITGDYQTPFRISPFIEQMSETRFEIIVKLRCCIPKTNHSVNVQLNVTLPQSTLGATFERPKTLSGQETEFLKNENLAQWSIKKFPGDSEHTIKINISTGVAISSREIGPISLAFEIPMYNASSLSIKYLRIADKGKSEPAKWVRYVTQSSSYVCRL